MKKKNIILVATISVVAILLIGLSIYKFKYYKKETNSDENRVISKEHYFLKSEIIQIKENIITNTLDKTTYSENIINNDLKETDFNFFDDKKSISGKIYIGVDKYLYILNNNSNDIYRVSTIKFKTMYIKDYKYMDGIYISLLGEDNKIYIMALTSNDITKAVLVPAYTSIEYATNFVNASIKSDVYGDGNTVFVLSKDGNIYDAVSGIRYNENIISLYNKIYVFDDNTMTNIWGEQIQDKNQSNYKIKYVFYTQGDSQFVEKERVVIITEDDRFIYLDKDIYNVYEFNKKVKEIRFDKKVPYVEGSLIIIFEDNFQVNLKVIQNEYFTLNEFELN